MSMLTSYIQHSIRAIAFEIIIRDSIFVHQYLQYRTDPSRPVLSVFDIIRHITGATEFDSMLYRTVQYGTGTIFFESRSSTLSVPVSYGTGNENHDPWSTGTVI